MAYVLGILNHKGGVGKTTTAINLAAALSYKGKKVLLIDMDPQHHLTRSVTSLKGDYLSIVDVLHQKKTMEDVVIKSLCQEADIIPSWENLAETEMQLLSQMRNDQRLKDSLQEFKNNYDWVIIDNTPSFGLLIYNTLFASDYLLIPVEAEMLSLMGLPLLERTLQKIEGHHPTLKILGTLLCNVDYRKVSTQVVREKLENLPALRIFKSMIGTNTALSNAPAVKKDAFSLKDKRGMKDYTSLANEILNRIEEEHHDEK